MDRDEDIGLMESKGLFRWMLQNEGSPPSESVERFSAADGPKRHLIRVDCVLLRRLDPVPQQHRASFLRGLTDLCLEQ